MAFFLQNVDEMIFDFLAKNTKGVLEILGPTGSGKTGFSIEIAKKIEKRFSGKKCEIISVDSRQVYRNCDISSAKISESEKQNIPHHGLNLVDLDEEFNVFRFQKYAFQIIEEIFSRHNFPILCGGTMLWLDAISENYIFSVGDVLDEKNVILKSCQKGQPKWPVLKIGLNMERKVLYERLNARAKQQFETGLIEETQKNLEKYPQITKNAFTSFGYQEIKSYLEGAISYEEAITKNQQRNRNYAKRQLTWWRKRKDVFWKNVF